MRPLSLPDILRLSGSPLTPRPKEAFPDRAPAPKAKLEPYQGENDGTGAMAHGEISEGVGRALRELGEVSGALAGGSVETGQGQQLAGGDVASNPLWNRTPGRESEPNGCPCGDWDWRHGPGGCSVCGCPRGRG